MICEWVDDDKPLAVLDIKVPHTGELLGPSSIKDLQDTGTVIHLDLLQDKKFQNGGKIEKKIYLLYARKIIYRTWPTNNKSKKITEKTYLYDYE